MLCVIFNDTSMIFNDTSMILLFARSLISYKYLYTNDIT